MFWVGLDIQFGYLVRFALVISGFLYLVLIIPDRIVIVCQILKPSPVDYEHFETFFCVFSSSHLLTSTEDYTLIQSQMQKLSTCHLVTRYNLSTYSFSEISPILHPLHVVPILKCLCWVIL